MNLVDFLKQRLDEDEAVARDASDGAPRGEVWAAAQAHVPYEGPEPFVEFHPARVLAEVEAKRRIVEQAVESQAVAVEFRSLDLGPDRTEVERTRYSAMAAVWYEVVTYLAAAYSDHPDYDESWRP